MAIKDVKQGKVSTKTLKELFKKAKSIKTLTKVYFKLHLDEPKTDYAIARATNPIWINKNEVERFFEGLVDALENHTCNNCPTYYESGCPLEKKLSALLDVDSVPKPHIKGQGINSEEQKKETKKNE